MKLFTCINSARTSTNGKAKQSTQTVEGQQFTQSAPINSILCSAEYINLFAQNKNPIGINIYEVSSSSVLQTLY